MSEDLQKISGILEAALLTAFAADESLYTDAFRSKIIMVTPSTLMAVVKLVEGLWTLQKRKESADEIAEAGRRLYEKLTTFAGTFIEVGEAIQKAGALSLVCVVKHGQRLQRRAAGLREQQQRVGRTLRGEPDGGLFGGRLRRGHSAATGDDSRAQQAQPVADQQEIGRRRRFSSDFTLAEGANGKWDERRLLSVGRLRGRRDGSSGGCK